VADSTTQLDRRLVRLGRSLVMAVPDEVVKRWGLNKGDQMRVTVLEGEVRIEPKQPTKVRAISQKAIESYLKAAAGIEAKVSKTADNEIRLEFAGDNQAAVKFFVQKLWENLPLMFKLMGMGSVSEVAVPDTSEKAKVGTQ
jgi:antitoxin component of MazEF toxin-antitoxin module